MGGGRSRKLEEGNNKKKKNPNANVDHNVSAALKKHKNEHDKNLACSEEKKHPHDEDMQTTNNRDDGGEWNCVGKKGKSKSGTSNTQGPDNQTSNKKVERQSLKNGRTLSFQEFQQTGAQNEAAFQQAEGDHMAIGIGRGIVLMGSSSDYGLTQDEILAKESLLCYFVDIIKRLGPLRIDGNELKFHLSERLTDSDSMLVGRGAESLFQTENFGTFLAGSSELVWVDNYICAKKDEDKAKDIALSEIVAAQQHITYPASVLSSEGTSTSSISTQNNSGSAIYPSSAALSSIPATNVWKSGPPSMIATNSADSLRGITSNSHATCSPDVMVLGNVNSLYNAAVRAADATSMSGQVPIGHPVFPVKLPDLTSPPPPLPSTSKHNAAPAPLSVAVGANRPVATVDPLNNVGYKTSACVGSLPNASTDAAVGSIESLNKRLQGLSLCNADLLKQLSDKELQVQRLTTVIDTQDQKLNDALNQLAQLKKEKESNNTSDTINISESESSTYTISRETLINSEAATSSSDNQLIISLQKQLESEKLNSRNLKQQLELERSYASQITGKQSHLYHKLNQNKSIHSGPMGNSSLLGNVSQSQGESSLSASSFISASDSFGLRGLLANTASQHNSTQRTNTYEGLIGSDNSFQHHPKLSTNLHCITQTPNSSSSSVTPVNGLHHGNSHINSAITLPPASGFSSISHTPFQRSEQMLGEINSIVNCNTGSTQRNLGQNVYTAPSSDGIAVNTSETRSLGAVGGTNLPYFGIDDQNSFLRGNSIAGSTAIDSFSTNLDTAAEINTSSQNATASNDDLSQNIANFRLLHHSSSGKLPGHRQKTPD